MRSVSVFSAFLVLAVAVALPTTQKSLRAGVATVDATPPVGVPLAGYNYPPRRPKDFPIPHHTKYTTFMTPSVGVMSPIQVKALVLDDETTRVCLVTIDAIGISGNITEYAHSLAVAAGFSVALEHVTFSASHSHSGPGALSNDLLFELAPATDLPVKSIIDGFAHKIAEAMVEAEKSLGAATLGVGSSTLVGATHNRRHSPTEWSSKVDTSLGVLSVDGPNGQPLATLWNFAIHGICYDADNLVMSSDVMGGVNAAIEKTIGGVGMFVNGAAGDVNPVFSVMCGSCQHNCTCPGCADWPGAMMVAEKIQGVRNSTAMAADVSLTTTSHDDDFGDTSLNLTLSRIANCTQGGPLDICTICETIDCDANLHLGTKWIEHTPRFTGLRIDVANVSAILLTMPGEALTETAWEMRNATQSLGYDLTFLAGYTNNYMGYFAPPDEYDAGDYESLLTLWGIDTAARVRDNALTLARKLAPEQ